MAEPAKPQEKPQEKAKEKAKKGTKPDIATLGGLALALGGILGGLILEGGSIKEIAQPTAAMIDRKSVV